MACPILRPALLAVILLAAVALPVGAAAQSVGVAVTSLAEVREDLPGGPGVQLSITHDPGAWLRIGGAIGVHRGRSSGQGTTCETYWPFFEDCRQETVRRSNDVGTLEASLQVLSPELAGFRVAPGVVAGMHLLQVRSRGEETGRARRPYGGEGDLWPAAGVVVTVERRVVPLDRMRLQAGIRHMRVRMEGCVTDTWALCATESFTRVEVGVAFGPGPGG